MRSRKLVTMEQRMLRRKNFLLPSRKYHRIPLRPVPYMELSEDCFDIVTSEYE